MPAQQNTAPNRKTQPLISFIVAAYNLPEELLAECIRSIRALNLQPDEREIIVADDGSDTPLPTLRSDISVLKLQHGGVSRARNAALEAARGTYVQFVDGDDRLQTEAYNRVIDCIRADNTLQAVAFAHTNEHIGTAKPRLTDSVEWMIGNNIRGAAWSYLFRKDALGNLRFTPDTAYAEDEEFTAQALLTTRRLLLTTEKAYFYRHRDDSATRKLTPENIQLRLDDTRGVLLRLQKRAATLPTPEREALQRRVAQLTMDYLYQAARLTRSRQTLKQRMADLESNRLFPLPKAHYTAKYTAFRLATNLIYKL